MTTHRIYSIKDTVRGIYLGTFMEDNDQSATRAFEAIVNDYNTVVGRYPNDHQLYFVGEYDQYTGEVKGCSVTFIVNGSALRKRGNNIVLQQVEQTEDAGE